MRYQMHLSYQDNCKASCQLLLAHEPSCFKQHPQQFLPGYLMGICVSPVQSLPECFPAHLTAFWVVVCFFIMWELCIADTCVNASLSRFISWASVTHKVATTDLNCTQSIKRQRPHTGRRD